MRQRINELRQERAAIWEQAKALNERALAEKRDFTADEQEQYDRLMADLDRKGKEVERLEAALKIESELGQTPNSGREFQPSPGAGKTGDNPRASAEYRTAFERFLTQGTAALSPAEVRMMAADPDTSGGFLVAPEQFVSELLKAVDDAVIIRQFGRGFQLRAAKSLGVPTLDQDLDDADWTTELRTGNETDAGTGKRELRPHPLAKRVKVSNTLLRLTAGGAETLVRDRLAYKFGVTLEKAYMTGDGNEKPLGLFVPSSNGITTDRDVVGANTTTQIKADTLIDALYNLKEAYQRNARWIFHRDVIKAIRKLKDGEGQYLWSPGIAGGEPDTILSRPFSISEFAPNDISAGKYVGLIGDLRYYWYVDALDFQIQRLVELYAESNQTGFIGRYEGDGQPVLAEAFARIKMADS